MTPCKCKQSKSRRLIARSTTHIRFWRLLVSARPHVKLDFLLWANSCSSPLPPFPSPSPLHRLAPSATDTLNRLQPPPTLSGRNYSRDRLESIFTRRFRMKYTPSTCEVSIICFVNYSCSLNESGNTFVLVIFLLFELLFSRFCLSWDF